MPTKASQGLPAISPSTRQVITTLLRSGPLPRVELARRLALTPASLTKLTRPMLDIGLFEQLRGRDQHGMGRPRQPIAINAGWATFIGIKLTADRAFAVVTDLAGTALASSEASLTAASVDRVYDAIIQLVNDFSQRFTPVAVGVGLAGQIVRSQGHVVTSPFLGWSDVRLAKDLESRLDLPVVVENDLRALTTSLHWFNDTLRCFALVTFGAGIGCGLVLGDRLIDGSSGAAGLVDHLRITDDGPVCPQGHRGCVSSYATTAGILDSMTPYSTETSLQLSDIGELARSGEALAQQVLRQAGYAMGCLIGTICNVTGPSSVILSGEGAELFDTLYGEVERGVADTIHPVLPPIPVAMTRMTFADWARGAAVVAIQRHLDLRSGIAA